MQAEAPAESESAQYDHRTATPPSASPTGHIVQDQDDVEVVEAVREHLREASSGEVRGAQFTEDSLYYDAASMASLNPISAAAIARLRAYRPPPFPLWDRLPARKRAAVLVLLYADRWGDLRVVVTMRAASLRNFSGHAALPGGKADSVDETPYQIARREAFEEIGLPMDDARLPKPFRIEYLCKLPPSLARTHLVVTPCVAFLHADAKASASSTGSGSTSSKPATGGGAAGTREGDAAPNPSQASTSPLIEDTMIPRLDAREVAAVFTAPFHNFLRVDDPPPRPGQPALPEGHWYDGSWVTFKDMPWRVHNFHVPVNNQRVSKPPRRRASTTEEEQKQEEELVHRVEVEEAQTGRFKVWGMTGRVLVDAARLAFDEEPEMEHNAHFGDAEIITVAEADGGFAGDEGAKGDGQQQKGPAKI